MDAIALTVTSFNEAYMKQMAFNNAANPCLSQLRSVNAVNRSNFMQFCGQMRDALENTYKYSTIVNEATKSAVMSCQN